MSPEENELQNKPLPLVPDSPMDRNALQALMGIKEYLQDPNGVLDALDANYLHSCSLDNMKQKNGGRTKVLLETVPVHKLADIFVASFEISFEGQLSMLDSVDLKVRLSKATELVDRYLQSIHVAQKITQKVEGQLSKSQKEFLLRQQMRAIKKELGDNDDDEDDVAALERKMQSAGMPSNIWKHAQRELRVFRWTNGVEKEEV